MQHNTQKNTPTRLAILVSHPIQYFVPLYRSLSNRTDIDLRVFYRTRVGVDEYFDAGFGGKVKWDIPLLEGYRFDFLSKKTQFSGIELPILWKLLSSRPDVLLLHGYNQPTNLLALLLAKMLGIKVLMRGDTRLNPRHQLERGKTTFKRLLFRLIDGFLAIGSLNQAYYQAYGVSSERIFFAPFCVQNNFFRLDPERRLESRSKLRKQFDIPSEATVVLFAAKLVAQKRPEDLLLAFKNISNEFPNACLFFVGSGQEEHPLREHAERMHLQNVHFLGFKNQSELPAVFAASDIFVLPSSDEAWGLVVNEVMAAGLPVIVSDDVGAAPDLVEGKETGFVFPVGDIEALSECLHKLIAYPELRHRYGENASALIARWDVDASANRTAEAAHWLANPSGKQGA